MRALLHIHTHNLNRADINLSTIIDETVHNVMYVNVCT